MSRYDSNLTRILKQYVSEENLAKLMSGDPAQIATVDSISKAKFETYKRLIASAELCENEEFNQLVEQHATEFRNSMKGKIPAMRDKMVLEEQIHTLHPDGLTEDEGKLLTEKIESKGIVSDKEIIKEAVESNITKKD